ncbi:MAG: hypothetical protein M3R25_11440, partial [Bacteroidota bacterium]|nr:hypothetical protein [Bacteroidota bacterium]
IKHDQSVANIFRQEYEARWKELGGTSSTSISELEEIAIRPNPVSGQLVLTNNRNLPCTLTWIDAKGGIVSQMKLSANEILEYAIPGQLEAGTYLIHWKWRDHAGISKILHIKS